MSVRWVANMAYTWEPMATYLKMPWKYHLPLLSLQTGTLQAALHLGSEAAPLLLSRTAGYALTSLARIASQLCQLHYKKNTQWEKIKMGLEMTSTLSPLLLVFSRIAPSYFIAAQMAKTGMELKENIDQLKNIHLLSREQICDRILPVISHAFFLLSLWRGSSYKIRLASIVFQGAVSYYQSVNHLKNHKNLDGFIWACMGTLRLYQGHQYYQSNTSSPHFVYKQRHAEKQKHVKHVRLTAYGHEQSRLAGPIVEKYLQEKTGKTQWTYASSTYSRSKQTAQGMMEGVGKTDQPLFTDGRLGERMKGEPKSYIYRRHDAAVEDLAEIAYPDTDLIIVDHSDAGRTYARQVDKTNEKLTEHHLKYVEGFLFTRQDGKTELLDRFKAV